ncbi:MAG: nuclear transport factor 2 family protein [Acidimicrobiales bacterium]
MGLDTADRFEIHELVARYNKAIDTGDADGWAATFTADGVFDGIAGVFTGREELAGFVKTYASDPQYADWAASQHWTTNLVIDGDGGEARLFAHVKMVKPEPDGGRIILVGWYEDELRKVDGRWLFAKRVVRAAG